MQARPTSYGIEVAELLGKKAEVFKYIARAYESQGDAEQAKHFFRLAAERYEEIGKKREADRCHADMAWVFFSLQGDANTTITMLHALLAVQPQESREFAEYLIELGQIHGAVGDDYEAEHFLEMAEDQLSRLKHNNPTGAELASALTQSLMSLMSTSGKPADIDGLSAIETQMSIRGLYRRLYTMREQIYRRRGDTGNAEAYRKRWQDMDGTMKEGNTLNLEFSQRMSRQLDGLLEQLDKFLLGS
jgi:tetratricopeptide (TPR) repeat protein